MEKYSEIVKKNYIINDFIKMFHSVKQYDTYDDGFNEEIVGFHKDTKMLDIAIEKAKSVDFGYYKRQIDWTNREGIIDDLVEFINWWKPYAKRSIKSVIKKNIKSGTLTTENDAREIAKAFLTDGIEPYEITGHTSDHLPRKIGEILNEKRLNHPYFKNKARHILYRDIWGRIWSKTTGTVKEDLKLKYLEQAKIYYIDTLGGMMWRSKNGRTFTCEYRTSEEEANDRVNPETFIG